jgi:Rps23 Pro-64 3,4-dihydroxylase Tpa1-like proline 4-hydroxylase
MWGGGLHQTLPGGMLRVHADFLKHPHYGLDRRMNLLLFLNKDWKPEYGGALELWDENMERLVTQVEPLANRCVIFTTSPTSYHGYTQPITCPQGMSRKSLAAYYYTLPDTVEVGHKPATFWKDVPGED